MTEGNTAGKIEHYDIVEHTLANYTKELSARLLDGWAISKSCPGEVVGMYGGTFTVSLYRDASTVERFRGKLDTVAEVPKLSRAAILANARKAKAAKKATKMS